MEEVRNVSTLKTVSSSTARHEPAIAEPSRHSARIQSMRDYIERHHGKAILCELEEKINNGEIAPRFDRRNRQLKSLVACSGTGQIQNITFRRFPGDEVCAEIAMTMQVMRTYTHSGLDVVESLTQRYRADMWISMDEEIFCDCGRFRNDYGEKNEEGQLLSEYLIPYFSKEDIEREAEDILSALCPEALQKPELINAENMTQLLGLSVIYLPFYKRDKTQSILFFAASEVMTEDEQGYPYKEHVPADTIVLNTNHHGIGFEKNAIFHECFHYIEHRLFFKLQKAASADVSCLPDWTPVRKQNQNDNPIEWIEWQARYESQCLQMPRSMVRERTNQALQKMRNSSAHDGVKLERIGRSLANRFHVQNYRARNRLIQTGYGAARGALNYGNNGYIQPFAFSLEECRGDQTFVIRMEDALREYVRNETFRKLLDSGRYVYVDGHFCLDEPKYVRHGEKQLYLTRWANAHIDECCLRFLVRYTRDRQSQYRYGQLNSDDEKVIAHAQEISEALMNLPGSFHGTLKAHMKRSNITIEKLEELAHISDRTIKRLRTEERKDDSLDQVIAICLALHLPPEFSQDFIEKAGFVLRKTPEHLIDRVVLRTMYMESIDTVQAKLRACGCAPLRLGEQVNMREMA